MPVTMVTAWEFAPAFGFAASKKENNNNNPPGFLASQLLWKKIKLQAWLKKLSTKFVVGDTLSILSMYPLERSPSEFSQRSKEETVSRPTTRSLMRHCHLQDLRGTKDRDINMVTIRLFYGLRLIQVHVYRFWMKQVSFKCVLIGKYQQWDEI